MMKNKTRTPTITTSVPHCVGIPNHYNHKRKRNKSIQIRKKDVKLALFADDMVPYRENPEDSVEKFEELINKSS